MYRLKIEQQEMAIRALSEGCGIRATERLVGVHRDSIMRLLVRVGDKCDEILDRTMRGMSCTRIELDEIWTFNIKKQMRLTKEDDRSIAGDQWIFTALCPDTKCIVTHRVGKRTRVNTEAFVEDLANRLRNRVQISADDFSPYVNAIDLSFGREVDFGVIIKEYEAEQIGAGRYAPPKVSSMRKEAVFGNPDMDLATTSHVENSNLNIRMRCRRLTRLTNAFSRKLENLKAAVSVYMLDYNMIRRHGAIRCTPAQAAGVSPHAWTWREVLEQVGW